MFNPEYMEVQVDGCAVCNSCAGCAGCIITPTPDFEAMGVSMVTGTFSW